MELLFGVYGGVISIKNGDFSIANCECLPEGNWLDDLGEDVFAVHKWLGFPAQMGFPGKP
jgi:hypothetical protein